MSWLITPTYTPPFPSNPTDGQTWLDVNTNITWIYSSATGQWSQQSP